MKYTPKLPEKNSNVTPVSPIREFLVLSGGLTAIVVAVYILLGFAVDILVPRISPEIEKSLSSPFLRTFGELENTSQDAQRIQALMNKLKKTRKQFSYDFSVHLVNNPHMNAVALPGGNIVVFTGLLDKIESENELAFVLAHEMGHYLNRDHLRGLGRSIVFMTIAAVFLGPDNSIGNIMAGWMRLTELAYSRRQETAADEFAMDTMNLYYGHTGGGIDFFYKMDFDKDGSMLGHFFSTHPEMQKRIAHLKAYSGSKGYAEGMTIKSGYGKNKN